MIDFSELILTNTGAIYHLNLTPDMIANKIILVGDPDRVTKIGKRMSIVHHEVQHREFHTLTGILNGEPVSVISTGIGTDNIDIVLTELDALVNIDFNTRTLKPHHTRLKILRLGTCGGVQADIPTGSLVYSKYSIGSDGLMGFYHYPKPHVLENLVNSFTDFTQTQGISPLPFIPYASSSPENWLTILYEKYPHIHTGITFTGNGFYGPQGRSLGRIELKLNDLEKKLEQFTFQHDRILNIEMETSGILGMANALGHEAGSLSAILANRSQKTFHSDVEEAVEKLIDTGIELFHQL
jgi:uridine phosphorylase